MASGRRTARFAVSISASLTAGLMTSVDMGKLQNGFFKKITDFPRVVPHFFLQKLNMSVLIRCTFNVRNSTTSTFFFRNILILCIHNRETLNICMGERSGSVVECLTRD